MNPIEYRIDLDCRRAESQVIITAKQGEASGRKITFSLKEGRLPYKVPSGVTAVLRAKKPSGAVLYNTCTVTADGNVEYTITTQTVAEVGKLPCELQLSQDGKVIFSPNFTLLVYKNLSVDSEVESSDEFTALQAAISRAESLTDGTTFTPTVSEDGVLSWTNDGGKANPEPVNIKGEDGAFRINVTSNDGVFTADKTFDEIKAAYDAGQQPYVVETGGTFDLVYTLANFDAPTDGSEPKFVDFERYLIGEDTLETEMLRIYSHTLANGSNIVKRTSSFNVPNNSYVLLIEGTESTESNIALTSQQVTALQNALQNNSQITLLLMSGNSYAAYYPIEATSSEIIFGKLNNSNALFGDGDVNQSLGRMIVAQVTIREGTGSVSFVELDSALTRFLPCSISISWTEDANSYTLTDKEYAILRQSLLDKRPVFIVRNTADAGGEQTVYSLSTCETPSALNVDSMTLVLRGLNNGIKVQMANKTIVPDADVPSVVKSVNGKTGAVTLNAEDIIYAKESQKLDVTIASLKAADVQMASDISELQTALQSKSITDTGSYFHTDTVEDALQEIGAELAGINTLLGSGIQISFTIDDGSEVNTFSVVSGTTFTEWIGTSRVISETSGLTLYVSASGQVFADEAGVNALSLDGSTVVDGSDAIVSGATYTIINWGG